MPEHVERSKTARTKKGRSIHVKSKCGETNRKNKLGRGKAGWLLIMGFVIGGKEEEDSSNSREIN